MKPDEETAVPAGAPYNDRNAVAVQTLQRNLDILIADGRARQPAWQHRRAAEHLRPQTIHAASQAQHAIDKSIDCDVAKSRVLRSRSAVRQDEMVDPTKLPQAIEQANRDAGTEDRGDHRRCRCAMDLSRIKKYRASVCFGQHGFC